MPKNRQILYPIVFTILFFANLPTQLFAQLAPKTKPVRAIQAEEESDKTWTYNATLSNLKVMTVEKLGAGQGASQHDGKIYLYGDDHNADPRCGVIREYDTELKPTGRMVWMKKNDTPLLIHPTGLTWDEKFGCLIGDTVEKKAKIYQLDWPRALQHGTLDNAVLKTINDDVATNGCRPLFVTLNDKTLLATADYGDTKPCIRLYDVEKLVQAERSSAAGVVLHTIPCGPFNQNLVWDTNRKQLICIQNVIAGRGWQLDVLDLPRAIKEGRADGPNVRIKRLTFKPHSELEGYLPLDSKRGLYISSYEKDNVVIGEMQVIEPRQSPAETKGFELP